MIKAISTGLGLGIMLSLLTGPAFFSLINTSIQKGFRVGIAMALGIVFSDMIFIGAILFGSRFFSMSDRVKVLMGDIGCGVILTIGIYYIFKEHTISYAKQESKFKRAGYFLKGLLMCIFNPAVCFHWIAIIGAINRLYPTHVPNRYVQIVSMFLTVLMVQFGLDVLKVFYADKLRKHISEKSIQRLNKLVGIVLIFAAIILYHSRASITHTADDSLPNKFFDLLQ